MQTNKYLGLIFCSLVFLTAEQRTLQLLRQNISKTGNKVQYRTCLKISVMKLTLVLELVRTLLTTSMSVSCSSSMEQRDEELGSLSVNVDVLEWLCSGSLPHTVLPDNPMLPPPDPDEHPLPSRWLSERIPPPPLSSELPAERAASPAAARWGQNVRR